MDWTEYMRQMGVHMRTFGKAAPGTIDGFRGLDTAAFTTQHLDAKTAELIALAVSVTTRCDGCIAVHAQRAARLGATQEEVAEAMGVAVALNAGAAMVYAGRAVDAVASATEKKTPVYD
jgi:AhpD family alkylhydroperoxidase